MTRRTYVYRVVPNPSPSRSRYLTRTGAVHRVAVLADHGISARIERSAAVTWGDQ